MQPSTNYGIAAEQFYKQNGHYGRIQDHRIGSSLYHQMVAERNPDYLPGNSREIKPVTFHDLKNYSENYRPNHKYSRESLRKATDIFRIVEEKKS